MVFNSFLFSSVFQFRFFSLYKTQTKVPVCVAELGSSTSRNSRDVSTAAGWLLWLCLAAGQRTGVRCHCQNWGRDAASGNRQQSGMGCLGRGVQSKTDVSVSSSAAALATEDLLAGPECRKPSSLSGWSINHRSCFISLLKPLNSVLFSSCYSGVNICRQKKKNLNQPKHLLGNSYFCHSQCWLIRNTTGAWRLVDTHSPGKKWKCWIHGRSQITNSK